MNPDLWATIRRLFEVDKLSKSAIAARLKIHRATVRHALSSVQYVVPQKPAPLAIPVKLAAHLSHLKERLSEYPDLSAVKLFREIKRHGYAGGLTQLKIHLRSLRPPKTQAFLKLETLPGEFAQVDWFHTGTLAIGNAKRKLSCFAMVLSYSRMLYLEFTLSQRIEDFMQCHVNAFHFFQGIPKKINYDNLRSVVLHRLGRAIHFNSRFLDFAGYSLFEPIPCNVRAPHEKGKIENSGKYIRSAFLAGRSLDTLDGIQRDADIWRDQEANVRIHGSTHERPCDRFLSEQPLLQKPPDRDYDCALLESVHVTSQARIQFERNIYTVPPAYAGKTLALKATRTTIALLDGPKQIAKHTRCYEKFRNIENPAHLEPLLRQRTKAYQQKLIDDFILIGSGCSIYFQGLQDTGLHLFHQLRQIQDLLTIYGKSELLMAIQHSLGFHAYGADVLKRILQQRRAQGTWAVPQPVILHKKPQWNSTTVEPHDLAFYDRFFENPPSATEKKSSV